MFIRKLTGLLVVASLFALFHTARADEFVWAESQPLGSKLPDFSILDTDGRPVSLSRVTGKKGTLLFFSRSTDW